MQVAARPDAWAVSAAEEAAAARGPQFAGTRAYEETGTWHDVGADSDSGFYSGWGAGDPAVYGPPQFLVDPVGIVHTRGVAIRYSGGSLDTIRLPGELGPSYIHPYWIWTNNGWALEQVIPTGLDTKISTVTGLGVIRYLSMSWPRA